VDRERRAIKTARSVALLPPTLNTPEWDIVVDVASRYRMRHVRAILIHSFWQMSQNQVVCKHILPRKKTWERDREKRGFHCSCSLGPSNGALSRCNKNSITTKAPLPGFPNLRVEGASDTVSVRLYPLKKIHVSNELGLMCP
jgi:hypothetical protein